MDRGRPALQSGLLAELLDSETGSLVSSGRGSGSVEPEENLRRGRGIELG